MGNWGWRMQVLNLRKMSQSIHPIPMNFDIIWKSRKTHPHSHNIAAAKKTPSQGNSLSNPSSTFYKAPKHGPVLQRNPRDRGNSWLCHHHRMPSSPSQTPEQENDGHRLQGKSERCLLSLSCGEQIYIYIYMNICVYCTHINICPVNWIHVLHIIYCICCASKQESVYR